MEKLHAGDCIRTRSGLYVNVFEPTEDMICIEDIAHALSFMPRFGGHLPRLYSVAQHSLSCAYLMADPAHKLAALMHDASEAYLMDIPRPIKRRLANYKAIEDNLMQLIASKFGFAWPLCPEVKKVDEEMLEWEWYCLMLDRSYIEVHSPEENKRLFITQFNYYTTLNK